MAVQAVVLAAFEYADDAVFLVDSEHRIVFWNRSCERLLGHPAGDALGRACHELIGGSTTAGPWCRARCPVWRSVERGTPVRSFDLLAATRSGKTRWANVGIFVLRADHELIAVHALRDAAEAKRLEGLVARLVEAFEAHGVLADRATPRPRPGPLAIGCAGTAPGGGFLTRRQLEVLHLVSLGLTTRAIAARLGLSAHTVGNHVRGALQSAGLHSRTEAVCLAIRQGLL